ncbi:MAG: SH3 domain-containing protein, partial [Desulfobacteraceae bacterium]|nr:SH3 domain-containing protein [Desulfobacteraceae bacterium]
MNRKLIFSSTLFFCLFFIISISFAATTLYVTSENAELKSESSNSSDTIIELNRGAELTFVSKKGRWYQVTTENNTTGWVYRGKVSEEEPE